MGELVSSAILGSKIAGAGGAKATSSISKVAGQTAQSSVAGASKGSSLNKVAGKTGATERQGGLLGKEGLVDKIGSFTDPLKRPGGVFQALGEQFGEDNFLGKALGAVGNSFDPLDGSFDLASAFDPEKQKRNALRRQVLMDIFKEAGLDLDDFNG